MPRPSGSRVMTCTCSAKVVGMPGDRKRCPKCDRKVYITAKPKKPVKPTKKNSKKA